MTLALQFPQVHNSSPFTYTPFVPKKNSLAKIIANEAYSALKDCLPLSLQWLWRKYVTHEISTIPLKVTAGNVTRVAYLHIHGKFPQTKNAEAALPVLVGHGDFGHPFSTLHLADIAQKKGHPTFSLYIPNVHNDQYTDLHVSLYKQAIDKIEGMIKDQGVFNGILGTGHSKGAILLAATQFVELDPRIKVTCAIGGRLNVFEDSECPNLDLKRTIKNIYQGVIDNPDRPLFQIIPKEDWCSPQAAMAVRPNEYCYSIPGMHGNGIHTKEAKHLFGVFLEEFTQK